MFIEINNQLINVGSIVNIAKWERYDSRKSKHCIDINLTDNVGFTVYSSFSMEERDNAFEKIKSQLSQCNIVKKIEL